MPELLKRPMASMPELDVGQITVDIDQGLAAAFSAATMM